MISTIEKSVKSIKKSDSTISAEFCFSEEDPIFAGHFPGMPVIPAVYQVGLCRRIIEQDRKLSFVGVVKSRFSKMCVPGKDYAVKILLTKKEAGLEATCSIYESDAKELCSKIVMDFK